MLHAALLPLTILLAHAGHDAQHAKQVYEAHQRTEKAYEDLAAPGGYTPSRLIVAADLELRAARAGIGAVRAERAYRLATEALAHEDAATAYAAALVAARAASYLHRFAEALVLTREAVAMAGGTTGVDAELAALLVEVLLAVGTPAAISAAGDWVLRFPPPEPGSADAFFVASMRGLWFRAKHLDLEADEAYSLAAAAAAQQNQPAIAAWAQSLVLRECR